MEWKKTKTALKSTLVLLELGLSVVAASRGCSRRVAAATIIYFLDLN